MNDAGRMLWLMKVPHSLHSHTPTRPIASYTLCTYIFAGVCSDPRDQRVADWLLQSGIKRVVVGHKPCGDSPGPEQRG